MLSLTLQIQQQVSKTTGGGGPVLQPYGLFLVLGQSNMQAFVDEPSSVVIPELTTTAADLNPLGSTDFRSGSVDQGARSGMLGQTSLGANANQGNGGIFNQLANLWSPAQDPRFLLAHWTRGGSGIVPGYPYGNGNWTDDGYLTELTTGLQTAITWLQSQSIPFNFRGVLWCLGTSEVTRINDLSLTDASDYQAALGNIIDTLQTNFGSLFVPVNASHKFFTIYDQPALSVTNPSGEILNAAGGGNQAFYWTDSQLANQYIRTAYNNLTALRTDVAYLFPGLFLNKLYRANTLAQQPGTNIGHFDSVHVNQATHNQLATALYNELISPGTGATSINNEAPNPTTITVDLITSANIRLSWVNPVYTGANLANLEYDLILEYRQLGTQDWNRFYHSYSGELLGIPRPTEWAFAPSDKGTTYELRMVTETFTDRKTGPITQVTSRNQLPPAGYIANRNLKGDPATELTQAISDLGNLADNLVHWWLHGGRWGTITDCLCVVDFDLVEANLSMEQDTFYIPLERTSLMMSMDSTANAYTTLQTTPAQGPWTVSILATRDINNIMSQVVNIAIDQEAGDSAINSLCRIGTVNRNFTFNSTNAYNRTFSIAGTTNLIETNPLLKWITVTYDGNVFRYYEGSTLVATGPADLFNQQFYPSALAVINKVLQNRAYIVNGTELIFNKALSSTEITTVITSMSTNLGLAESTASIQDRAATYGYYAPIMDSIVTSTAKQGVVNYSAASLALVEVPLLSAIEPKINHLWVPILRPVNNLTKVYTEVDVYDNLGVSSIGVSNYTETNGIIGTNSRAEWPYSPGTYFSIGTHITRTSVNSHGIIGVNVNEQFQLEYIQAIGSFEIRVGGDQWFHNAPIQDGVYDLTYYNDGLVDRWSLSYNGVEIATDIVATPPTFTFTEVTTGRVNNRNGNGLTFKGSYSTTDALTQAEKVTLANWLNNWANQMQHFDPASPWNMEYDASQHVTGAAVVSTATPGFTGDGYALLNAADAPGPMLSIPVQIHRTGNYDVAIRARATGLVELVIDGILINTVNFTDETNWLDYISDLALYVGSHIIEVNVLSSADCKIDKVTLVEK